MLLQLFPVRNWYFYQSSAVLSEASFLGTITWASGESNARPSAREGVAIDI